MKRCEKVIAATVIVPLAAFTIFVVGVAYYHSKPQKPAFIPDAVVQEKHRRETTFATENDIDTIIQPAPLEEIVSETTNFSQFETNTDESRRSVCIGLFKEAGYDPTTTNKSVYVVKKGHSSEYVAIGAHYDKVEGPSQGILDNMLGCILVTDIAEVLKDEPTKFTYLFLTYGDEEQGRKIGAATSVYRSDSGLRPTYVIEIDYVGDKGAGLGGRWLSPIGGRFLKTGIKITTYPMPKSPTIHTERDDVSNVDFNRAYLAYKTVISLIEGIEKGDGLNPPNTVNFWRRDKPLFGFGE
jgi:hypothetical protein